MFKLLKILRRNLFSFLFFFNQTALSRPISWCHASLKFGNSKCCIFKTKDATGLETCTDLLQGYLQPGAAKNSEDLAILILEI